MSEINFTVRGQPVPQGSSRAFVRGGRAVLVSKSARLSDWRAAVATEARDAMGIVPPLAGPVSVFIRAIPSERPASHWLPSNSRRPVRELRLDAPRWNASIPDADKLARAVLDSLTGVVFADDRQVAELRVTTLWPMDGEWTGITVSVLTLEETR
jgi:Holliday junction resolvase RusA-like endonuclease